VAANLGSIHRCLEKCLPSFRRRARSGLVIDNLKACRSAGRLVRPEVPSHSCNLRAALRHGVPAYQAPICPGRRQWIESGVKYVKRNRAPTGGSSESGRGERVPLELGNAGRRPAHPLTNQNTGRKTLSSRRNVGELPAVYLGSGFPFFTRPNRRRGIATATWRWPKD